MLKFEPPVVLHLQQGQLIRCDQPGPAAIVRVVSGRVWVTQAGDRHDHFLRTGESLRVPARSRALLSAETDAQVAFCAEPGWAGALARRCLAAAARLGRRLSTRPANAATRPATG